MLCRIVCEGCIQATLEVVSTIFGAFVVVRATEGSCETQQISTRRDTYNTVQLAHHTTPHHTTPHNTT